MIIVPVVVVLTAAIFAAATDIRQFKVYNALTFPLAGMGFLYHTLAPSGLGFAQSGYGLAVGFSLLIVPYALGGLGAGDVKFLAGIGAWIGPQAILPILIIGCIATGVYSATVILRTRGLNGIAANVRCLVHSVVAHAAGSAPSTEGVQAIAREPDRRERLVPFSAMLAIGVWCVIATDWYSGWIAVGN